MTYQANKLDKFRLITEKTLFQCYPSHQKKKFLSYKVANNNYLGGFFQVLIFESKLDTLPKTYQGGINYTKISIKITHYQLFSWPAVGISRKLNNF